MLAILAGLTACVVESKDGTTELEDGTIVVAWEVGASGCEAAGVTQVRVTVGDEADATFACADGTASFEVPPDHYDVHLDGLDAQGAVRYGGDTTVTVGAGMTVDAPTVVLSALPADLTVTWYFENGRLCSANGVEDVELTVFEDDFVVDTVTAACDDGTASLEGLVAGTYDVTLFGRDAGGVSLFSGTETVDLGKGDAVVMEIQLVED